MTVVYILGCQNVRGIMYLRSCSNFRTLGSVRMMKLKGLGPKGSESC